MIEQKRQVAAAGVTEGAWRAGNQDQIDEWVPELAERRRLRLVEDRRKRAEQLARES